MSPDEITITPDTDDVEVEVGADLPDIDVLVDSVPSTVVSVPSIDVIDVTIESETTEIEINDPPDSDVIVNTNPDVIIFPTTGVKGEPGTPGTPGAPGSPGPPGPQGPEGTQTTYTFTQLSPVTLWVIQHNLNRYPSVTVIDSGGSEIIPNILYIDNNRIHLSFDNITSGKAYLN